MYLLSPFITFIFILLSISSFAQSDNHLVSRYTFNNGSLKNDVTGEIAKAVGVTPTEDRFGNGSSAYYFHGSTSSYIALSTNKILKPHKGTISLWFMMENVSYAGKGYQANPIIQTKAYCTDDFNEAYSIGVEFSNKRICLSTNHIMPGDSQQVAIRSLMSTTNGKWYHVAFCINDSSMSLYINGKLQNSVSKQFRTTYLDGDSVTLGYSSNKKNVRFFNGAIDDIEIYNMVLSEKEISTLYNQGDPNRNKVIIRWLIIILACISGLVLFMVWLLRQEKAKNSTQRQLHDMEVQTIRAQMNPHFIFNAINSVQQFILQADNENANKYLVKFSRLLRLILESNSEEYIVLENEIDIITKYIEIEALRFNHSFKHQIVIDERLSTYNTKIPQMMIQPFIENAIWHGLLPKRDNQLLIIEFKYISPKCLKCIIEDNGIGRQSSKSQKPIYKKHSLAINYIQHRLKLISKDLKHIYTIQIQDKTDEFNKPGGTSVTINLPILN